MKRKLPPPPLKSEAQGLKPLLRCALYTRKSTEEGLDQDYNSLDNQRAACEAFILSQRDAGWVLLPRHYDDGGFSGGDLGRPAMQRLLADVQAGDVDVVVVQRIDRLTRSITDFGKIVEIFDRHKVSFVSVTQQFNTTTSMGRLTLNILLSFAQFERELTAERIREKIAAHKRLGKWCGGKPPLGYDVAHPALRLVMNQEEAALVRRVFERYLDTGSCLSVARELDAAGLTTKTWTTRKGRVFPGQPWDKALVYKLLCNRVYLGQVVHQGQVYPGEHPALIDQALWDAVQARLDAQAVARRNLRLTRPPVLLQGLLTCAHCNAALSPTYSAKRGKQFRYYLCKNAARRGADVCPLKRVPAGKIEALVLGELQRVLQAPELLAQALKEARRQQVGEQSGGDLPGGGVEGQGAGSMDTEITDAEILVGLKDTARWWPELFPEEQHHLARLLLKQVRVDTEGVELEIHTHGLDSVRRWALAKSTPARALGGMAK